jgi:hypothetical protein
MSDQQPKIIVDSDWKAQAQAEKERLAAKEAASKPAADGAKSAATEGSDQMPEQASFAELIHVLATQALLYMGQFPDPSTGQAVVHPELAKLHIDLLGVLEEKTKGNLDATEKEMLQTYLRELRGSFVELSRMIAKAVQDGRIKPQGGGMGGGVVGGMGGGMGGGVTPASMMPPTMGM